MSKIIMFIIALFTGSVAAIHTIHPANTNSPQPKLATPSAQIIVKINPSKKPTITIYPKPYTPKPIPSLTPIPTPTFKSSFATIVLAGDQTNATGKIQVELYNIEPSYDPRAKLASFRINGNISGLNPNTDYNIGMTGVNGGGVQFANFHTDGSGNASITADESLGYTPDNPLSILAVEEEKAGGPFRPVLKGNFTLTDNSIIAN